jgi:hypothetical protein
MLCLLVIFSSRLLSIFWVLLCNEEDVEIIDTLYGDLEDSNLTEENKALSEYWIHEKVLKEKLVKTEEFHLHIFSDGFMCRKYNIAQFLKTEINKLLEENVLDVTRNFDKMVQSFRNLFSNSGI